MVKRMHDYKSPIELIAHDIMWRFAEEVEGELYKTVTQYGIHVDKEELLKALAYDRGQYEKGYADAKAEIVRCKDCKHWIPGNAMCGNSLDDMQRGGGCPIMRFLRRENDFCCCGERKENND